MPPSHEKRVGVMNQGFRNPRRIRVLESMDFMDSCVESMPDSGDLFLWQSGAAMLAAYWICLASGVLLPCYILPLATLMELARNQSIYLSIYQYMSCRVTCIHHPLTVGLRALRLIPGIRRYSHNKVLSESNLF